jgi:hypothetical protein
MGQVRYELHHSMMYFYFYSVQFLSPISVKEKDFHLRSKILISPKSLCIRTILTTLGCTSCIPTINAHATAATPIGSTAGSWFELQSSGKAAVEASPMAGNQASAAYARYLKSFDKEIPERFGSSIKDAVSTTGGNGR